MLDLPEFLLRLHSNALSWRIRRGKLRVLLLEFEELTEQAVVLGVADNGIVLDVVAVVVILDFLAQLGYAGCNLIYISFHGVSI
jgi:hypothetical protein